MSSRRRLPSPTPARRRCRPAPTGCSRSRVFPTTPGRSISSRDRSVSEASRRPLRRGGGRLQRGTTAGAGTRGGSRYRRGRGEEGRPDAGPRHRGGRAHRERAGTVAGGGANPEGPFPRGRRGEEGRSPVHHRPPSLPGGAAPGAGDPRPRPGPGPRCGGDGEAPRGAGEEGVRLLPASRDGARRRERGDGHGAGRRGCRRERAPVPLLLRDPLTDHGTHRQRAHQGGQRGEGERLDPGPHRSAAAHLRGLLGAGEGAAPDPRPGAGKARDRGAGFRPETWRSARSARAARGVAAWRIDLRRQRREHGDRNHPLEGNLSQQRRFALAGPVRPRDLEARRAARRRGRSGGGHPARPARTVRFRREAGRHGGVAGGDRGKLRREGSRDRQGAQAGRGGGHGRTAPALAGHEGAGEGRSGRERDMNISDPFIKRPVMTTLVMTGILLFGIQAYRYLPVSDLPNVDFPTIQVAASLPGASPDTMASAVATPLERQFTTIAGLDQMTSANSLGSTVITLQFDLSRSIDGAAQDVQAAIAAAARQLPPTLPPPPSYKKVNPADQPILYLALTSATLPLSELDEYGETMLAQRISTISGVAQVLVYGSQKYAVRLQVDPKALATRGIGIDEVANAVSDQNVNLPTGTLYGPRTAYTVQANGQLTQAKSYRNLIVAYRNGNPVRLEQLGRVLDSVENNKTAAWFVDQRSVILAIQRQPGTNTVAVAQSV